jgi:hypothetical protein
VTLTEGIHWVIQQPDALVRNHCFMTIGSRLTKADGTLDARTPALWISNGTGRDGPERRGCPKVGCPKVGSLKVGSMKVGSMKVGSMKVGSLKVGSPKVGSLKVGFIFFNKFF